MLAQWHWVQGKHKWIGLCWVGRATADEAEDRAVVAIMKLNSKVKRDETKPGNPVVDVALYAEEVTDADLKELAQFKHLRSLRLACAKVTGSGFKDLTQLEELTSLDLDLTELTDVGLKEIAKIKGLTKLHLYNTARLSRREES